MTKIENKSGSNVSAVTNLCEQSLCDESSVNKIAKIISEFSDSERIIFLRGLSESEIAFELKQWRKGLLDFMEETHHKNIVRVNRGNTSGNFSRSDLICLTDKNEELFIEAKFGFSTNSALGVRRVSSLLNYKAFSLSVEQRKALVEFYLNNDVNRINETMRMNAANYVEEFNRSAGCPNSRLIKDVLKSSGKRNNSKILPNYYVINFRPAGKISETSINVTGEEIWEVQARISERNGIRVSYILFSDRGQKLKLLFNNKNTNYVNPITLKSQNNKRLQTGKEIPIPSFYGTGPASYNAWYSEGE